MEELCLNGYEFKNWKGLYMKITKAGTMYRRKSCDILYPDLKRFYTKRSKVWHRPLVYKDNKPVAPPACNKLV